MSAEAVNAVIPKSAATPRGGVVPAAGGAGASSTVIPASSASGRRDVRMGGRGDAPACHHGTLMGAEFLVICGLSGAGGSRAGSDLEDLGWFVIDNVPP